MALEHGIDLVLLAHHRRDQAETFLLQALRGAGVEGLSAMPRQVRREGVTWARPWLDMPTEAIHAYVRRHRLRHVDDGSNVDPRFARNRLRNKVWPALIASFPDAELSLAAAARHAQDGAAGLAEWAALDMPAVADEDALDVARWRTLSSARQSNVLRAWLRMEMGQGPAATLVARLLDELRERGGSRWPTPTGELRCHRGRLRHVQAASSDPATGAMATAIDLSRVGSHRVDAWRGQFSVRRAEAGGMAASIARSLELRPRSGGERFQSGPGRPPRSLKLQYQAAGVPAWQRIGPLVVDADGSLVFVPGLGLDARALAAPGTPQLAIDWQAD